MENSKTRRSSLPASCNDSTSQPPATTTSTQTSVCKYTNNSNCVKNSFCNIKHVADDNDDNNSTATASTTSSLITAAKMLQECAIADLKRQNTTTTAMIKRISVDDDNMAVQPSALVRDNSTGCVHYKRKAKFVVSCWEMAMDAGDLWRLCCYQSHKHKHTNTGTELQSQMEARKRGAQTDLREFNESVRYCECVMLIYRDRTARRICVVRTLFVQFSEHTAAGLRRLFARITEISHQTSSSPPPDAPRTRDKITFSK